MHRSEESDMVGCVVCGAQVSASRDRTYAYGADGALCFACAVARGGLYDEQHDRWLTAPDLSGLVDPEYPA